MENNFIKSCLVTFLRAITQRKNKRKMSQRSFGVLAVYFFLTKKQKAKKL